MYGNQTFGGVQTGGPVQGQGYSTLREFGTNPQEVRSHIAGGYQPSMTTYGTSPMHAGATDPRVVQGHIAQDLGYGGAQAGHYATTAPMGGSILSQFGSQPQMVQQHIRQDLAPNYGMTPNYATAGYGPSATVQQVMQSVPSQVYQPYGGGYTSTAQTTGYGTSTFAQYGTDPQTVQQHIQNDLQQQVGSMTSQQAGGWAGAPTSQYQPTTQSPTGMFNQFATNPQQVRQHIQQDLGYYQ